MDILEKLRAETRGEHDKLEAIGLSDKIMDKTLSLEEYKKLIRVHFMVHQALEEQLEANGVEELFPALDYEQRRKMPLLEQDIGELGIAREPLSRQEPAGQLPQLNKPFGLLGCMYVLEGATLGGMVIVKALKKNEHLSSLENFHYFGCYGGETGPQWKRFLEVLKDEGAHSEAQEPIVEAARQTYQYFGANFKKFL
ncbi:biliverdin-producing heme oxygenase [Nafulsella turpanensis]|uniref:biliverdin-producing heme oxygenase n=1 Tax=Nafulsella turpanensis TaxID=1265690 RepID=UPI0003495393|nr:biliverdin-producing heme oxygenase [Nafulsella turpanensis]